MMDQTKIVANGVVVSLEYVLTVDGEEIDSSGAEPLQYLQGYNNIIPGLERELAGLGIGESKDVVVAAKDAYGEVDPDAFADIPRDQFPPSMTPTVGERIRVRTDNGRVTTAAICEVTEDNVRLDLNHPLAGKVLNFRARIADLRDATPDELAGGRVGGCSTCGSSGGCNGSCG